MGDTIVSGEQPGLKRPGKRIAVAVALLVGAIIIGWTQRGVASPPRLIVLDSDETVTAAEISVRELGTAPPGAPEGFECLQAWEIKLLDPSASFSGPFTVNFYEDDADGLSVILITEGRWEKIDSSRPWFGPVDVKAEGTRPGVYALGRLR